MCVAYLLPPPGSVQLGRPRRLAHETPSPAPAPAPAPAQFVNASYDGAHRNGTCPDKASQFFVGFQWENGLRDNEVAFAFPTYRQSQAFHDDAIFAVNTALNYII